MAPSSPNPVIAPQHILNLLDRLHRESSEQEAALGFTYLDQKQSFDDLMRDKFIALDQDKCQFIYQLATATGARNIVEVGTSFGVSTIYLALAVGKNVERLGGNGKVIGTEWEASKADKARGIWAEAGEEMVSRWVDLRVGDLQETLKDDVPSLDLVLLDSTLQHLSQRCCS